MIASPHVQLFWRLLEADLREPRLQLPRSYADMKERLGSRGMLLSGATVLQLQEATRMELISRVGLAWQLLQRVLSDVGLELGEDTGASLQLIMKQVIDQSLTELSEAFTKALPKGLLRYKEGFLADEAAAQMSRYEATIDLFLERLRRQVASAAQSDAPVFNFHAPVGAVLSGPNAVSSVSQHFTGAAVEQLESALKQVRSSIATHADALEESRDEVLAIIDETTNELASPKPNRLRVKQLATGVATAIQTAGSVAPAYAVLKSALAHFGIIVP